MTVLTRYMGILAGKVASFVPSAVFLKPQPTTFTVLRYGHATCRGDRYKLVVCPFLLASNLDHGVLSGTSPALL